MRPQTEAAIQAAGIAQRIADSREGADQVTSKGGIDLVTATDLACEDAIRAELTRAFPGYPVIGEERGGSSVAGMPYWLVDPICGTRPFASNVPLYCTNIALVENGTVTVAAVGVGQTGELLYAERGAGAWMRTAAGDRRLVPGEHSQTVWIGGTTGGRHRAGRHRRPQRPVTPSLVHLALYVQRGIRLSGSRAHRRHCPSRVIVASPHRGGLLHG